MLSWRIYYDDGSTFDSSQGEPEDAPSFGVVFIPQPDEQVGRMVMQGWDWYYFNKSGQWWGCDIYGLLDRLLHNLPTRALKQGRTMGNDAYQKLRSVATNDPDFPIKSATRKGERP